MQIYEHLEVFEHTVYVKSFKGENFCGSSHVGKTFTVRTLCYAANPETIYTHNSSVYGMLELKDGHVLHMHYGRKKQENSKLTVLSVVIMCTGHQ